MHVIIPGRRRLNCVFDLRHGLPRELPISPVLSLAYVQQGPRLLKCIYRRSRSIEVIFKEDSWELYLHPIREDIEARLASQHRVPKCKHPDGEHAITASVPGSRERPFGSASTEDDPAFRVHWEIGPRLRLSIFECKQMRLGVAGGETTVVDSCMQDLEA